MPTRPMQGLTLWLLVMSIKMTFIVMYMEPDLQLKFLKDTLDFYFLVVLIVKLKVI